MSILHNFESPFNPLISFKKVIDTWEFELKKHPNDKKIKDLIDRLKDAPELYDGFSNMSIVKKHEELILELLAPIFPQMLSQNQISAVTFPWCNTIINPSKRFQQIIEESKQNFCINNENFNQENFYVASCSFILGRYYKVPISDLFPIYFRYKNKKGITKHYRIIYNPDFLEITPTSKAIDLTPEDIELLLNNLTDVELWKKKIPPHSWILKGFGIMNMYDSTLEIAFSNLKQRLSGNLVPMFEKSESENESLKSIFDVSSLEIGISDFSFESNSIVQGFYNLFTDSLLLKKEFSKQTELKLNHSLLKEYIDENKTLIVSSIPKFLKKHPKDEAILNLFNLGFKSCALVPLRKGEKFLGLVELCSTELHAFKSTAFYRINMIHSFLTERLDRAYIDFSNLKSSIIQKEYTRLHPSVSWKFEKEAEKYLKSAQRDYNFKEIIFQDVIALYGQIDVRNSSKMRNKSIVNDFKDQISMLINAMDELSANTGMELLEQKKFELEEKLSLLKNNFESSTETDIFKFISDEIHPILTNQSIYQGQEGCVEKYLKALDPYRGSFYNERKKFDDSINQINRRLSAIIDKRQTEIQEIFPHYFERFNTDGVEHTMYMGASIAPNKKYNKIFLQNLRLWQLQIICEMLNEHQKIKDKLPMPLDVTSLILVFNQPFSIRFRMDEKRFDVDGAYNAHYEVLKKRIDKSHRKGSTEKITQSGKIAIIYTHSDEEKEYLKYIHFLQNKNILDKEIEHLEVEDFQGITGLKALRVSLKVNQESQEENYFNYEDFIQSMN